jgi:hypothetical protein
MRVALGIEGDPMSYVCYLSIYAVLKSMAPSWDRVKFFT